MEQAPAANVGRGIQWPETAGLSPNSGEVVFTTAAGLGLVCAVLAAGGAWMLMTDPDRLMWIASAALTLVGR